MHTLQLYVFQFCYTRVKPAASPTVPGDQKSSVPIQQKVFSYPVLVMSYNFHNLKPYNGVMTGFSVLLKICCIIPAKSFRWTAMSVWNQFLYWHSRELCYSVTVKASNLLCQFCIIKFPKMCTHRNFLYQSFS